MPWRRLVQRYPRVESFVDRRLDAETAFGRHVTLGVLCAGVGIGLFTLISFYAGRGPDGASLDTSWNAAFFRHAFQTPSAADLFRFITDLGDTPFLAMLTAVVAVALGLRGLRRRKYALLGALWIVCALGGALLNFLLKDVFQRQRPALHVIAVGGWSFPSGHAMGSFVVYGMLAYLLLRVVRRPLPRKLILVGTVVLVGLIGFSRVYLGAHWPSDVLGGWNAGAVWLALCISTAETMRRQHLRDDSANSNERPG